jgi:predicted nucleotidyltransferase
VLIQPDTIEALTSNLKRWAAAAPGIVAIAVVGSHARGTARVGSDVDIVIICTDPKKYLESIGWLSEFGGVEKTEREDWGLVQSWRVFYQSGIEVEFCITTEEWCSHEAIDSGTGRVIKGGAKIVFDPRSLLSDLILAVSDWKDS